MSDLTIEWIPGWAKGEQILACNGATVGAVVAGSLRFRWRAWITGNRNGARGSSLTEQEAKAEVELRFRQFLEAAELTQENR